MLAMFKALSSLIQSSPEYWPVLQHELESAIESARAANKYDDLAIFLFQLGNAMHYLRREVPDDCAKAVGYWRECLATVRDKVPSADQKGLKFVEKQALDHLSIGYSETAIHAEGAELADIVEKLQEAHKEDRLSSSVKYVLASLYTSKGQLDKARDLLRSEMVTAFNILVDDDIGNDWQGFVAIRHLLAHTGDYENARKISFLIPARKFNGEVLMALFADEEPSLEIARETLAAVYERECTGDRTDASNLQAVLGEAQRLSAAAEPGSEEAAIYSKVLMILNQFDYLIDSTYSCNNCNREWDYEMCFHICKYCHSMDLCDVCYNDLQSDNTTKVLICSKLHDWWELAPWTIASYVRAWKRLIPVKAEDGSEELIDPSKWLGTICEQWGLSKSDWNFE
ncbi:tetratricopeptide repeat protein [Aspergillus puulaauensis]|uniref:Uncharacterized protein n=1 Tax=Aspergillus puulaauensis TaxID=1220207 RepID=A0A7R7XBP6_9EURO|nr:uncharacterized protein APUU_10966S [Aspergillus puulaauensis]BCS18138.1 hypothetical protein APUU_10966S [Aspergillus puulaauensis]